MYHQLIFFFFKKKNLHYSSCKYVLFIFCPRAKLLNDSIMFQTEHSSHERCSSPNSPLSSSLSSDHLRQTNPAADFEALNLNYPPSSSSSSAAAQINLFEEAYLDLKLQSSSSSSNHNYQSVCTLDKVKSALQRAERETTKKRQSPSSSSAMFAAACPGCLLYVITLKTNPKCPRCNSTVPSPLLVKKARIDLNASV